MNFSSRKIVTVGLAIALAGGVLPLWAVSPTVVEHATQADFATGELSSTALTSSGELRLGPQIKMLMHSNQSPFLVSALAVQDKAILVASGSDDTLYRIADGNVSKFAKLGPMILTSLLVQGDVVLVGASGAKGAGIYQVDSKGVSSLLWSDPDVQYIWAILANPAGGVYAATGPKGKVFAIDADGKGQAIYSAGTLARNIMCLARGNDGTLYAGTDENGLILSIDPAAKTSRVLLDAQEKEISSLLLIDGALYAATSDISRAGGESPGQSSEAVTGMDKAATTAPATAPAPEPVPAKAMAPVAQDAQGQEGDDEPEVAPATPAAATEPAVRPSAGGSEGPAAADGAGNAVYRIAADGLVRPVFRRAVSIYAMLHRNGELILATGNSGQIFAVRLSDHEETILADTEAAQVTAIIAGTKGELIFGTSNKGSVGQLGNQPAASGTFTSKPIDAQQIARWGTLRLIASGPDGSAVTVSTRSGNLAEPREDTWSQWSPQTPATDGFLAITSPAGRYLQYRLTLQAGAGASPKAGNVRVIYQVGNLSPEIAAVTVTPAASEEGAPGAPPPAPGAAAAAAGVQATPLYFRTIAIQASDANADSMIYGVEYRQLGSESWIRIAEKLDKPQLVWDTRGVGDGTYEFRITASDLPANPPASALVASKLSAPVVVDNTPPAVKDLQAKVEGGQIAVSGLAVDAGNRIASIQYSVNSATEWTAALPTDGICDSDSEKFTLAVKDAKPGLHRISVKVLDAFGNAGYGTISVNVGKE